MESLRHTSPVLLSSFSVCLVFLPPGIGSEEVQPFSMSLEAEMMLEQLKEQHHQEMQVLQNQLESKVSLI